MAKSIGTLCESCRSIWKKIRIPRKFDDFSLIDMSVLYPMGAAYVASVLSSAGYSYDIYGVFYDNRAWLKRNAAGGDSGRVVQARVHRRAPVTGKPGVSRAGKRRRIFSRTRLSHPDIPRRREGKHHIKTIYALKENQNSYGVIFGNEKEALSPENAYFWNESAEISA